MMGRRKLDEMEMQRRVDELEDRFDRRGRRLGDRLSARLCTTYVNRELIERAHCALLSAGLIVPD